MIKQFSDLKRSDEQLFNEVVQACTEQPDQSQWFCTKTFAELKRVAEFISAHSWELDMSVIEKQFTDFENAMVKSLINSSGGVDALASRERMARTGAQRTTRFVEHYLSQQATRRDMLELQSKLKQRPKSDGRSQWESLKSVFN